MALPVGHIREGRSYKTSTGQVRHVVKNVGGTVSYAEKTQTENRGTACSQATIGLERFAAEAVAEVNRTDDIG